MLALIARQRGDAARRALCRVIILISSGGRRKLSCVFCSGQHQGTQREKQAEARWQRELWRVRESG
jgi:hypothetical protein